MMSSELLLGASTVAVANTSTVAATAALAFSDSVGMLQFVLEFNGMLARRLLRGELRIRLLSIIDAVSKSKHFWWCELLAFALS